MLQQDQTKQTNDTGDYVIKHDAIATMYVLITP